MQNNIRTSNFLVIILLLIIVGMGVFYFSKYINRTGSQTENYLLDLTIQDSLQLIITRIQNERNILQEEKRIQDSITLQFIIEYEKAVNKPLPYYLHYASAIQLDSFWAAYKSPNQRY
jgi:cell division protein YceG involved in septum cleavage